MRKSTIAAAGKPTVKELLKDLEELIKREQHFIDSQKPNANNPSVKPMLDNARGRLELAEALEQHLRGNSVQFKILKGMQCVSINRSAF